MIPTLKQRYDRLRLLDRRAAVLRELAAEHDREAARLRAEIDAVLGVAPPRPTDPEIEHAAFDAAFADTFGEWAPDDVVGLTPEAARAEARRTFGLPDDDGDDALTPADAPRVFASTLTDDLRPVPAEAVQAIDGRLGEDDQ